MSSFRSRAVCLPSVILLAGLGATELFAQGKADYKRSWVMAETPTEANQVKIDGPSIAYGINTRLDSVVSPRNDVTASGSILIFFPNKQVTFDVLPSNTYVPSEGVGMSYRKQGLKTGEDVKVSIEVTFKNPGVANMYMRPKVAVRMDTDAGLCSIETPTLAPTTEASVKVTAAGTCSKVWAQFWAIRTGRFLARLQVYSYYSTSSPTVDDKEYWLASDYDWTDGVSGDQAQTPGRAPTRPGNATDNYFTAEKGGKLGSGCVFHSAGPLEFDIPVTRYVAPTNGVGRLNDLDKLKESRVVAEKARLRLMVYDVDTNTTALPGIRAERDEVFFNDEPVGKLTGSDASWTEVNLDVPIEKVKFPEVGDAAKPPTPMMNRVRIDLDLDNNKDTWCVAVDWGALYVPIAAPLMLVHGTHAQSDTWEFKIVNATSPVDWLNEKLIPYFHKINLERDGSFKTNATMLNAILTNEAKRRGVQGFHILAHSKGGSDTRYLLSDSSLYKHGSPYKILSLYSIGTPSQGTILSDVSVEAQKINSFLHIAFATSSDEFLPEFLTGLKNGQLGGWLGMMGFAPVDPAREIQRMENMRKFNLVTPRNRLVGYYSIAGDADIDHDNHITQSEAAGVFDAPYTPRPGTRELGGNMAHIALSRIRSIQVEQVPWSMLHPTTWAVTQFRVTGLVETTRMANDLVTTVESAHCDTCGFERINYIAPDGKPYTAFPYNHSQLKSGPVMQVIWDHIQTRFPVGEAKK